MGDITENVQKSGEIVPGIKENSSENRKNVKTRGWGTSLRPNVPQVRDIVAEMKNSENGEQKCGSQARALLKNSGKYWKIVENGGKWWKMVGNSGK